MCTFVHGRSRGDGDGDEKSAPGDGDDGDDGDDGGETTEGARGAAIVGSKPAALADLLDGILRANPDDKVVVFAQRPETCLLYTSPSPRDQRGSRMPSSA